MRGSVAAGACAMLHFLGLQTTIDRVYGSSAGAMIAAYFVCGNQGFNIFPEVLPTAGRRFINKIKLLTCTGVVPSRLGRRIKLDTDVFNLDYLLWRVMDSRGSDGSSSGISDSVNGGGSYRKSRHHGGGGAQSFDYITFKENNKVQPLTIITTQLTPGEIYSGSTSSSDSSSGSGRGLSRFATSSTSSSDGSSSSSNDNRCIRSIPLTSSNNHWNDIDGLLRCIR